MEQIDAQVSDLRFLTQAPVPLPSEASTGYSPPVSATPGDNSALDSSAAGGADSALGAGSKRKSEDEGIGGSKQQRSKRNRYISIACNECKRRKIKCNGETPCQRCGNLNLACLYAPNCCSTNLKDSDEFKQMAAHVAQLQEQVDSLMQNVHSLRTESFRLGPLQADRALVHPSASISPSPSTSLSSLHKPESHKQTSSFRGPTSMAFSLDVANNTIHEMGYKVLTDHAGDELPPPPSEMPLRGVGSAESLGGPVEPLWEFDKDELVRLCRAHDEEVGIMYPVVSIQSVIGHARALSLWMEGQRRRGGPMMILNDDKTLILKMVMCCALAVEEHGHSDKAIRVYESCESVINRKLMADAVEVANLPLLALLAGYRFLSNDEILAWRVMGQVVRLCLEMGIHRRSGLLKIQNDEERRNALNSFWSAYVLDRRWAFGTGLPYVAQDSEIDPELPMPDEFPYLVAMITYSRLGAKVWQQVSHFGPVLARDLRQEEMENLDQEILRWYETVPEEVKLRNWDKEKKMTSTPSYNLQRLRIWTYLRFNQIRIWLYTPVLHSATSIMTNPAQAQRVVDLAKDTIRYLSHLNNTTNLYRKIQVFYHQFLTSAIAVVFLASVHAPVHFSNTCRDEFYMALELVKDLSAKSWVSKRLWRTISSLKEVAPSIGLKQLDDSTVVAGTVADPHSAAALTMAGLASGRMAPSPSSATIVSSGATSATFGRPSVPPAEALGGPGMPSPTANNGARIQTEMTHLFENYLGMNGFPLAAADEGITGSLPTPDSASVPGQGGYSAGAGLYQHFSEMY